MVDTEFQYMYGLQRFGVKPGLAVMEQLMDVLGHPEKKFKSIHIAGTNGKGSTAAFLDSVLRQQGYKVGLYTSPHLVRFNERIQVDGEEISHADLTRLVKTIREVTEKHGIQATFFEFTTALAFLYFAEQALDIAVIEVGMGGRLDATNVITPILSVITMIGLDHVEILGNTPLQIAKEKAGIIKEGIPVVVGEKSEEVVSLFQQVCAEKHTSVMVAVDEITVKDIHASLAQQSFAVEGLVTGTFTIHLLGRHQIDNAVTALAVIAMLRQQNIEVSDGAMTTGLRLARWDGRMQVVLQRPLVIVDGAHNIDGAKALFEFIQNFPRHSVLLLAQKEGKEMEYMMKHVVPLFDHVIVTEGTYEPMRAEALAEIVKKYNLDVEAIPVVEEAVRRAYALTSPKGFLLITGSLYMIGGALEVLQREVK